MQTCPKCSRHVWETESRCPFCSASLRSVVGTAPTMLAALAGLALFACGGDPDDETTAATPGDTSSSPSGTDSMSSTNGQTSSSTDMTGSATSTSPPTSDTTATPTSEDPTTVATTDVPDTSTGTSSSDTSTSSSDGSSSGASESSDGGTTQMTTGGDCTGPGEQICDGVCVNTLEDDQHCGDCETVCNQDQFEQCNQGECEILIPPYGAPMPEPMWI
ncbi:MAG: hypothetical protein JNL82_18660 [Myxococcales bacterium]|nr:hypothetical protein [Myxococcales bacterium]